MRRAKGTEDANTLVLEAVIIAVLLMAAILIPNFTPAPVREEASSRRGMAQTVEDLLAHLGATADPAGKYPTALDRVVAEALQDNATFVKGRVARTMPVGVLFNALLHNGEALRQLHWERDSAGESVSAARLWSPSWEAISAVPAIHLLPADRASLEVQAVPLHRAYGFAGQPGVQAVVELELPGGAHVNVSAFTPLQNRSALGPSLSLALRDAFAAPAGVVTQGSSNRTLVVWVKESQGRAAPAGTLLQVKLPPGTTDVGINASRNPGWTDLAVSGNTTYGWTAEGKLASDLSGAEKTLEINATLSATGRLQAVEATIDRGAAGSFVGIVRNASAAATTAGSVPGRGPWLMLPQLAPWSAQGEASLVIANPENATGRDVWVHGLALEGVGGATLEAAAGSEPAAGWALSGGVLTWSGNRTLASNDALDFRFTVRADAPKAGDPGGAEGLAVDVRNFGYTRTSAAQRSPGLWLAQVQPREPAVQQGYDTAAGVHNVTLNMSREGALMKGTVAYEVSSNGLVRSTTPDLARGVHESSLAVDTPSVPLGGTATVRWDLRRAVEELGVDAAQFKCYTDDAGAWMWTGTYAACEALTLLSWQFLQQDPDVTLRVYHPSPVGPWGHWPLAQEFTGLDAEGDQDIAIPTSSLLGTHVVEIRAEFRAEPFLGGGSLTQRVSLLGSFDVHREGRAAGLPSYSLILQAWLPDWG